MPESIQSRTEGRRTIWLLTGAALALAGLAVLAGIHPSAVNWGIHSLAFLSPGTAAAVAATLILALIPAAQSFLVGLIQRMTRALEGWPRPARRVWSAVLLGSAAAAFWFARERTYFMGDGFLVIRTLGYLQQSGDVPGSFPTAPLSAMAAWQALRVFEAFRVEHAALLAWQSVSIVAGLVSVTAIWKLSGMLWHESAERVAGFLLLAMSGAAQMMFGYVETYPAAYAMLWIYVVIALRVVRGESHVALATAVFVALCLFHLGMAILLPSLFYLWWRAVRLDGWRAFATSLVPSSVVLPVLLWLLHYRPSRLIATAVRDGAHYLPVASVNAYADAYTLFSLWHVADIMNLFLLLAPFSLLMLGAFIVSIGLPRPARPPEGGLWYSLGWPAGLWVCMNSFELGMSRDWDLAAPFGIVVVLGSLVVWHHVTEPGGGRQRAMVLMALFTTALTFGWISVNADREHSRERFERLLDPRVFSGSALADAHEELGGFYREQGKFNEASASFARCVALDSTNARRWQQLAGALANAGQSEYALRAYERGIGLGSKDPLAFVNAGIVQYQLGRPSEGMALVRKSLEIDSTCAAAALALGTLLYQEGSHDAEALSWLERAAVLDPANIDVQRRVATCRARLAALHTSKGK
jgi:tetratricopeptide (TPR) repeat protein